MLKGIRDTLSTIKEIKGLLAFFGINGVMLMNFADDATIFFYANAPLVSFTSIILLVIYIEIMKKAMLKVQLAQHNKISEIELNQRKRDLIARVDSMYKEYGNKSITDEWVAKSLSAMKDELDELEVNSYTQGKLEKMISNFSI